MIQHAMIHHECKRCAAHVPVLFLLATLLACAAPLAPAAGTSATLTWTQQEVTPLSGIFGVFGNAVGIDGDTLLVGAPWTDVSFDQAGLVYVYRRASDGIWFQAATLQGDGLVGAGFGKSIALHGNFALVGAPGVHGANTPGSVYLFERLGTGIWVRVLKATAADGAVGDRFGDAVAFRFLDLNPNQDALVLWAAIGADGAQIDGAVDAGAVYVKGWTIVPGQTQYVSRFDLKASAQTPSATTPVANARLGSSVALSTQGRSLAHGGYVYGHILAGAPGTDEVLAFDLRQVPLSGYFVHHDQTLTLVDSADPINGQPENFGFAMAMDPDGITAAISAPSWQALSRPSRVAMFALDTGSGIWSQQSLLLPATTHAGDFFGRDLDLAGGWLVVGSPWQGSFNTGAGYAFRRDPTGQWVEIKALVASNANHGDSLGAGAGVSGDGTVALGAPIANAAWIFTNNNVIFDDGFE